MPSAAFPAPALPCGYYMIDDPGDPNNPKGYLPVDNPCPYVGSNGGPNLESEPVQ